MEINFKINGKALLASLALSVGLVSANFVSIVDSDSAGGISIISETSPVGTIVLWGTSTPPDGWIELNGQDISGYSKLSTLYPSGLPDLRGEFVRGWDNGRGIDSGRVLGSFQQDTVDGSSLTFNGDPLPSHSHSQTYFSLGGSGGDIQWGGDAKRRTLSNNTGGASAGTPTGTIQGSGTETKPRNISLMYIIKAE